MCPEPLRGGAVGSRPPEAITRAVRLIWHPHPASPWSATHRPNAARALSPLPPSCEKRGGAALASGVGTGGLRARGRSRTETAAAVEGLLPRVRERVLYPISTISTKDNGRRPFAPLC